MTKFKIVLLVLASLAFVFNLFAQTPAYLTNSVAWDPSPSGFLSSYTVLLTTNKVTMGTNGYNPPASAIITTDSVPATSTSIQITNLWPQITNGVYSVFVKAVSVTGLESLTSSNLVINMNIPPLPVRNLRLQ